MNGRAKPSSVGVAFTARVGVALVSVSVASGQNASPAAASSTAQVERVIVTGSNIPAAEEVGPNPVDTYRPSDIEKLGVRNSTDLLINLPQEMGTAVNQNWSGVGDGSVIPNLRGLLPKETLVLIDGKRAAIAGGGGAFGFLPNTAGVDINLIPFPIIDHIDILKDGASAVYGSDAVAGVINIFLLHKFRGLEIGGSYGNTNMGASNDAGEWEGWLKAGTGDDKTDIVVIADFYDRAAIYNRDRFLGSNEDAIRWGGFDSRTGTFPGAIGPFRLIPRLFFSPNSPPPHSAPNVASSRHYISIFSPAFYNGSGFLNGTLAGLDGNYVLYNFAALIPSISPEHQRQDVVFVVLPRCFAAEYIRGAPKMSFKLLLRQSRHYESDSIQHS
jgi:outer membrane receptor protein involved in Fe transport